MILTNIFIVLAYLLIIIILAILIVIVKNYYYGNFGEGNIFKTLNKIYHKYDYPYIKQIILPINKGVYTYYDAIVFGDYYIYIIEVKNHDGLLMVDTLSDWTFIDKKTKEHTLSNPFYDNEVKKHILNRLLDLKDNRIIEIIVANNGVNLKGRKGDNIIVRRKDLAKIIRQFENRPSVSKMPPAFIEKKGNFLLSANIKNRKIRKKVINDLIDSHSKK